MARTKTQPIQRMSGKAPRNETVKGKGKSKSKSKKTAPTTTGMKKKRRWRPGTCVCGCDWWWWWWWCGWWWCGCHLPFVLSFAAREGERYGCHYM
jgi:hypothetical protein